LMLEVRRSLKALPLMLALTLFTVSLLATVGGPEPLVPSLSSLSSRAEYSNVSLILWVTPWSYRFGVGSFPQPFVPGVVVAYDCDCGLCVPWIQGWFATSMYYVRGLLNASGIIFINFFCEEYVPSYVWRGTLTDVFKPPEQVVAELKRVVGDGRGVYMGFSELTACVNSDACFSKLVEVYSYLRSEFPDAKFYYYGSGGDSVDRLVELFNGAGLDLVGIDVWELEYRNGSVTLSSSLLSKLAQLAERVGWNHVILGEVGLRVDDEEAYVEPWNWSRTIKYNPNITAVYYRSIFEDMLRRGVRPAYVGIWAWNDGVFAVGNRSDILSAIVGSFYAEKLMLSPTPAQTAEQMLHTSILVVSATAAAAICVLLYFYAKKKTEKRSA